ncbi:MAG: cellulose biosynthesis protein BcsS [Lysobacter sp.]
MLVAAPAVAESVWVGGLSGAGQTRVAYLSRIAPFPHQRLGEGWAYALSLDQVHYEYEAAAGHVNGDASSFKVSLLRDFQLRPGTLTLGGGLAYQDVALSPSDPTNDAAGAHVRMTTEAQWRSRPEAQWASQAYAQYVSGVESHYASGFLGHRLKNALAVGAQVSSGGDRTYRIHGIALAVRGWKYGSTEFSFHAGAQHQEGEGTEPEFGISFVTYRP